MSLWVLFALLVSSGCRGPGRPSPEPEDDIREAVLRYQLQHNEFSPYVKVYFLSLYLGWQDTDPNDRFMERFRGHQPSVKKVSQSTESADGIRDKETGDPGVILRVAGIPRRVGRTAEVTGGYYRWHGSFALVRYYLVKEAGRWTVTREEVIAIT